MGQTYKKCDRCKELFEIDRHYGKLALPVYSDKRFADRIQYQEHDLCPNCLVYIIQTIHEVLND